MAYKILADSNIDWGQNRYFLLERANQDKDLVVLPEYPTAGKIVVDINNLVGVTDPPDKYKWLNSRY